MSMYQLIIVLSLAAVLHADCVEWDVSYSANYNFNPADMKAANAWVCERYGISKPTDIAVVAPQVPDTKYCFKVGAGNQELFAWLDTLSPINHIRSKFCGLLDFQCFAETFANGLAIITTKLTAILNIVININILKGLLSQGFSSDDSNIPSNVACTFGMFNIQDTAQSLPLIDDAFQKGWISEKVCTIDLHSAPGKVTLGSRILGGEYFIVPLYNDIPWVVDVTSMAIGEYVLSQTALITRFDSMYNCFSIGDLNSFNNFMTKIGAVKGADGNYRVNCATVSELKNLDITMANGHVFTINMQDLIQKSGNECICLVQFTPGKTVCGNPCFDKRILSNDFSNRTLAFTNPA